MAFELHFGGGAGTDRLRRGEFFRQRFQQFHEQFYGR